MKLFKNKDDKALEYMKKYEKLYGDKFEIVNTDYSGFSSLKDVFYMSSTLMPKNTIVLECINGEYKDNYIAQRMIIEYQNWITPILREIIGECKSICEIPMYTTNKFTENTTLKEFMHECRITENIISTDLSSIDKINDIVKKIKEMEISHTGIYLKILQRPEEINIINDYFEMNMFERKSNNPYMKDILLKMDKNYNVYDKREGLQ